MRDPGNEPAANPIERAAADLIGSQYAIVLTGAGISTESGIQDFRGPQGLWTTNRQAEAKAYERYGLFLKDPKAYWEEVSDSDSLYATFFRDIRDSEPNPGHHALAALENLGIVKCIVTQNVDGLHEKAGSKNVIHYHGTVHKARCASCGSRFELDLISLEDLPPRCGCGGIIKLDVVHFTEPIPSDVMEMARDEALKCDLMLICGTSAVVYPFAALPRITREMGKQNAKVIEINAEPTSLTHENISDYLIQGQTGKTLPEIVERVGLLLQAGKSS
ncbi:MAG: NAD-dependent deacylase [Dehalococcoidia bacterium]|nr:NAD-dependent deacylase [Dehalococcoidia bacterium]